MNQYLLILRDHGDQFRNFDDAKRQAILTEFTAWNDAMRSKDQFVGAGKLSTDRGLTVQTVDDELRVDGPYSEAKEAIGGYYCVAATDVQAAAEIAKGCPILGYGGTIEVRELDVMVAP